MLTGEPDNDLICQDESLRNRNENRKNGKIGISLTQRQHENTMQKCTANKNTKTNGRFTRREVIKEDYLPCKHCVQRVKS